MADAQGIGLQFQEQIEFFRQKINLPTASWTAIWQEEHDRAFVVAGAMRDDILTDFRAAVDKAISQGTTLEEFRKDFDAIVDKTGWQYNGGRNWRSQVIYQTNLSTSRAAGRWSQVQAVKHARPYVRYRHMEGELHPRPIHQSWDGLVLRVDDPWVALHWTPNGWGCQCYYDSIAERNLKALGKTGPDKAPPIDMEKVTVGINGPNPRVVETPHGVDPGFGYAPGKTWSKPQASAALDIEAATPKNAWKPAVQSDWQTFDRPARIPLDATDSKLVSPATNKAEVLQQLTDALGGESVTFNVKGLPVVMDAPAIADHIGTDLGRSKYFPLLVDALTDPFEVWVSPEVNDETGDSRLRSRIIKAFDIEGEPGLVIVADFSKSYFRGWTIVPASNLNYLQKQRLGLLLYGR